MSRPSEADALVLAYYHRESKGHPETTALAGLTLAGFRAARQRLVASGSLIRDTSGRYVPRRGDGRVTFTAAWRQVTCSSCGREYQCVPADDYYHRPDVADEARTLTNGVCEPCLLGFKGPSDPFLRRPQG